MPTFEELLALHRETIAQAGTLVGAAATADLGVPTPCAGWDLRDLLSHMIGQQDGFAVAVVQGDAPAAAYEGPAISAETLRQVWEESAGRLDAAFAAADPAVDVHLVELGLHVPAEQALGMQLLDTAVHAWDVAVALGETYRPSEPLAAYVLDSARFIASLPGGLPEVFAGPLPERSDDAWADALRLLGRSPAWPTPA